MAKNWKNKLLDFSGSRRRNYPRAMARMEERNRARGWGWPWDGFFKFWIDLEENGRNMIRSLSRWLSGGNL